MCSNRSINGIGPVRKRDDVPSTLAQDQLERLQSEVPRHDDLSAGLHVDPAVFQFGAEVIAPAAVPAGQCAKWLVHPRGSPPPRAARTRPSSSR